MLFKEKGVEVEIANNQIGQNFAGEMARSAERAAVKPADRKAETPEQSVAQNEIIRANDVQVDQQSADNQNSEKQDQNIDLAVEEVQSFLQAQNRNLSFSVDEGSERAVVTVKDSESGDVIRQIPSDEVLRLAERIKDLQEDVGSSVGVLINREV
ncbi:flagellar protein FlaG [Alteromonas sp. ASW11-19]|uniref:Flagellar protein FlaG n=1 Tax=Alteromonas salexigens TaxID=2982530 RepID=A0ABT2VNU6_9ALTE|nr:flagellar protein FlaG [Alteromonas salexigens]MCU7554980.1 flagellar protein FlaG [Alteromonas salexigens]